MILARLNDVNKKKTFAREEIVFEETEGGVSYL